MKTITYGILGHVILPLIVGFIICSISLHGMDTPSPSVRAPSPSVRTPSAAAAVSGIVTDFMAIAMPSEISSDDSEGSDDDLCQVAINSYYPPQYRSDSSYILPFLRRVFNERRASPVRESSDAISCLRKMKSGEISDSDSEKSNGEIQALLLEAAHQAMQAREQDLIARSQALQKSEERLEKKMSKKSSALITTLLTTLGAALGAVITLYSK